MRAYAIRPYTMLSLIVVGGAANRRGQLSDGLDGSLECGSHASGSESMAPALHILFSDRFSGQKTTEEG